MRRTSVSQRLEIGPNPRGVIRRVRQTVSGGCAKNASGGSTLFLLALLLWLAFYENLPDHFGLNQMAVQGAVSAANAASADVYTANTLDRIIKVCMLAMSVYVVAKHWSVARSVAKHVNPGAVALLALAPLSMLWSIEPSATILRSITLLSIAMLCFAISLIGWHPRRFQQFATPPLMFILVTSLVLGILYPKEIIEVGNDISQRGAWHGITLTKNQFGMTASFGVIIYVNSLLAKEKRAYLAVGGATVAFACLILSRSDTSLFATALAVLFMIAMIRVPAIRERYAAPVTITIIVTLLVYELVIQDLLPGAHTLLAPIRDLTGKDSTFSARTIIWDVIKAHIRFAPYLGSGYGAYWVGAVARSPSYVFTYLMYFYPTEAHNGYLDIVNDLGFLGLLWLLVFLFFYIRQGLQLMRFDRRQATLYLALLLQQMIMNMSESEWFARDSTFAILILGVTCMSRDLYEGRRRGREVAGVASRPRRYEAIVISRARS